MNITMQQNGSTLDVILDGRLDTASAPKLEQALKGNLGEIDTLNFDFTNVGYISSAGLRVVILADRSLRSGGKTYVKNANDVVKDVFAITGLSNVVNFITV